MRPGRLSRVPSRSARASRTSAAVTIAAVLRTRSLADPAASATTERWLTEAERARADSIADARDRRDYLAAHALVRVVAGRLSGTDPAEVRIVQRCPRCGESHGRPEVDGQPGLQVSFGHSRGAVIAAAGTGTIGADIEGLRRPAIDLALAEGALTGHERRAVRAAADPQRAFLRHWTRKEAAVKAGLGRLRDLAAMELGHLAFSGAADATPAVAPLGDAWPGITVTDQIDEQNEVAFAVISADPVELITAIGAFPELKGAWCDG